MRLSRTLAALALTLVSCCSSEAAGPVQTRTLIGGDHSAIAAPSSEVLRTADEWSTWWARHAAGGLQESEPPVVDWNRDMVVAVTLGERPSLGYSVELASAVREGETLRLLFREREPAPGMLQGQVMTHPFACVALPRSEGHVEVVVE